MYTDLATAFTPATRRFAPPERTRRSRLGFHVDEKGNLVRDDEPGCAATQSEKTDELEPISIQAKSCCTTYQAREELMKELTDTVKKTKEEMEKLNAAMGEAERQNTLIQTLCLEDNLDLSKKYDIAAAEWLSKMHDLSSVTLKRYRDTIAASEETIRKIMKTQLELRSVIALAIKDVFTENPLTSSSTDCSVCKVNTAARVFVPCGHTACEECAERIDPANHLINVGDRSCYFCRSNVERVIKLYLG